MAAESSRPSVAVVVGSGGLGRALFAALADDPAYERVVLVSRRRPADWSRNVRRTWLQADILDEVSLEAAAAAIAEMGDLTRAVVATGRLHGPGLAPEKTMRSLSAEGLGEILAINAIGPALAAKHLLPLTPRDRPSLFAALSARVGSIGDNHLGGWYAYRASKAALNMLIRTLAVEHRRTRPHGVCVALHPGTVDTELSAPFQSGVPAGKLFSPEASAAALVQVMAGLTAQDTGGFFAWDGATIPW
jgi:NAD(P)-dependent dehydrogenase (short-subunit alcohol dehydrogenase family)